MIHSLTRNVQTQMLQPMFHCVHGQGEVNRYAETITQTNTRHTETIGLLRRVRDLKAVHRALNKLRKLARRLL